MASTTMALLFIALTEMFMSRTFTLARTVAPASRHTLARVLSRHRSTLHSTGSCTSWPVPTRSSLAPHSHRASVVCDRRRFCDVRKDPGCSWNSSWVGEPWNTSPLRGPQCERKTTGQSALSPESGTRKRKSRDVARQVAILQAPVKLGRALGLRLSNQPNSVEPRNHNCPTALLLVTPHRGTPPDSRVR